MKEILMVEAFEEITKQIENNNLDLANKMLSLVTYKIKENKKNNKLSDYIKLTNDKEKALFSNILEK